MTISALWALLLLLPIACAGIFGGFEQHTHESDSEGGLLPTVIGQPGQARLILSGGNLTLTPYNGNVLRVGGFYRSVPAAGLTLGPSGLTPGTTYYIYVYHTGVALALEASPTTWTVASNGDPIKTGDSTRLLVGMAHVIAGPAFMDDATRRFVLSYWHRRPLAGINQFTSDKSTTSGTWVELSAAEGRVEFLTWGDLSCFAIGRMYTSASSARLAIGLDGIVDARAITSTSYQLTDGNPAISHVMEHALSEGYHFVTALGLSFGGVATATYRANPGIFSFTTTVGIHG